MALEHAGTSTLAGLGLDYAKLPVSRPLPLPSREAAAQQLLEDRAVAFELQNALVAN